MGRTNNKNLPLASAIAALVATLGAAAAQANTMPPTTFTYNVVNGLTPACPTGPQSVAGTCTSGVGFATADGGVVNNTGTSVSAGATGPLQTSLATMTYYFEVGGPTSPTGQVAVDVLSSGAAFLSGGPGLSLASLVITDAGPDAAIASNTLNPYGGSVVDYHYDAVGCTLRGCSETGAAWTQTTQLGADHLCLTQGEVYAITIEAGLSALGKGASGSASVDPKIIVDPQGPQDPPTSCYQPPDPSIYQSAISISDGASTGVSVPEPGTLGLMGLGLFGLGLGRRLTRRARARR